MWRYCYNILLPFKVNENRHSSDQEVDCMDVFFHLNITDIMCEDEEGGTYILSFRNIQFDHNNIANFRIQIQNTLQYYYLLLIFILFYSL